MSQISSMTVTFRQAGVADRVIARSTGAPASLVVPRKGDRISFVLDEGETLALTVTDVHWVVSDSSIEAVVRAA